MDTPEVPSQPESAADIVKRTFADYVPQEPAQAEVATPSEEPQPFDPATIKIPGGQYVANVPKALEKFKDKTLVDFANSYEEAEKGFHAKAQEAAAARRENEELKARLAAAEQFTRMSTPQAAPQTYDPYQGINPDEAIITDPRRVLNATLTESQRIARAEAERAAKEAVSQLQSELQRDRDGQTIVTAFEMARKKLSEQYGRDIPVEEWQQDLQYIAPVVMRENAANPGRMFDHNAYVEHAVRIKGAPVKATVPTEGNPPLSSKPAAVKNERGVPTMDKETREMNKRIRAALGLPD